VTTIILGIGALLLALLPAVIYDERPKWPWSEEKPKAAEGVTFKTKRFQITLGGDKELPAAEPPSPTRPYLIALIIVAVVGIGFAPFAWTCERHRPIAASGAAMCCIALTWQYIIVGVVVGVALALFLYVLGHL
jgi:hypothetical protein